jgi:hypothetical protein
MAEIKTLKPPVTIISGKYAGYSFPAPKWQGGYKFTSQTFVDAGRNLNGVTIGQIVRDGVRRLDITFAKLTPSQWHEIAQLFDIQQGGSFYNDFSYWDDNWMRFETATFYHGDLSPGEALGGNPNHPIGISWYINTTLPLIFV